MTRCKVKAAQPEARVVAAVDGQNTVNDVGVDESNYHDQNVVNNTSNPSATCLIYVSLNGGLSCCSVPSISGVDPDLKGQQMVISMSLTTRYIEVRGLPAGPCCKGRRTNIM